MKKIVVFAPVEAADAVREAAAKSGAGRLGNYSHASFSSKGVGRFKPEEGARPAIGATGQIEAVQEERIEFVCTEELLERVLAAIRAAHPYEMPAIESYPVDVH